MNYDIRLYINSINREIEEIARQVDYNMNLLSNEQTARMKDLIKKETVLKGIIEDFCSNWKINHWLIFKNVLQLIYKEKEDFKSPLFYVFIVFISLIIYLLYWRLVDILYRFGLNL